MLVTNAEVAHAFEEMADLWESQAANPFRLAACRAAARTVAALPMSVVEVLGREGRGGQLWLRRLQARRAVAAQASFSPPIGRGARLYPRDQRCEWVCTDRPATGLRRQRISERILLRPLQELADSSVGLRRRNGSEGIIHVDDGQPCHGNAGHGSCSIQARADQRQACCCYSHSSQHRSQAETVPATFVGCLWSYYGIVVSDINRLCSHARMGTAAWKRATGKSPAITSTRNIRPYNH
jgi:hypothetical protein